MLPLDQPSSMDDDSFSDIEYRNKYINWPKHYTERVTQQSLCECHFVYPFMKVLKIDRSGGARQEERNRKRNREKEM